MWLVLRTCPKGHTTPIHIHKIANLEMSRGAFSGRDLSGLVRRGIAKETEEPPEELHAPAVCVAGRPRYLPRTASPLAVLWQDMKGLGFS